MNENTEITSPHASVILSLMKTWNIKGTLTTDNVKEYCVQKDDMKEVIILERTHCGEDGCTLDQCNCSRHVDTSTQTYSDVAKHASDAIGLETAIRIDKHITKLEESRKKKKDARSPVSTTSPVHSVPNTDKAIPPKFSDSENNQEYPSERDLLFAEHQADEYATKLEIKAKEKAIKAKLNWADDSSVSTLDAKEHGDQSIYDRLCTSSMTFEESKNQYAILTRDTSVTPSKREILLLKQSPKDKAQLIIKRVKSMPKKETLSKGFVKIAKAINDCAKLSKINVQAEDPTDALAQDTAIRLGTALAFDIPVS
uniref:Uncharacterized protein n=1 Tax=viral metagenome TaxID=1070528 RepID=A0A2V0RAB3_9ZZZZ